MQLSYRRRIEKGSRRQYSYTTSPVVFCDYPSFCRYGYDLSNMLRNVGEEGSPSSFTFNTDKRFLDFVKKQVAFRNREGVGDKVVFDAKYVVKPPHGSWYRVTIYKKKSI